MSPRFRNGASPAAPGPNGSGAVLLVPSSSFPNLRFRTLTGRSLAPHSTAALGSGGLGHENL
ncbi:hypothetical protein ACRE_040780 [Hapsidospora chrysogenum ATCC 11550]|uniref:Uncharacterized protein n=1 Tax=Hapsidospora chrysogenum (strain ATCC 11550 / CBS 779.69 / DSM 880 / IAM 14645 / JCM 23072 / IMI 49137) TaxID=857340 RepID=A0A086T703_HAPC1|nr:hypothetical protein ACRE_040780 [Hapsidospora chrysogenum ATCC 11550]